MQLRGGGALACRRRAPRPSDRMGQPRQLGVVDGRRRRSPRRKCDGHASAGSANTGVECSSVISAAARQSLSR